MRWLLSPCEAAVHHLLDAAEAILGGARSTAVSAGALLVATLAAWWLYVPIHELLHAFGCLLTGGGVSELQIAPLYGGHFLERVLPFVSARGEHAGRLAGFDTGGSDAVYLATDVAPYLMSIAGAFPMLRAARRRRSAACFGAGAVLVAAPLMGLTGDYFEMAGILVSAALLALGAVPAGSAVGALRCDDLPALLADFPVRFPDHRLAWAIAVGGTFLLGGLLVTLTLAAARRVPGGGEAAPAASGAPPSRP